jgi:4-hydroxyphenylpyruvate dioxygenase
MTSENPIGLRGIDFVEFASPEPEKLDELFLAFGFSRLARHEGQDVVHYAQNDIHFLLNREPGSFAEDFARRHGPSICSMGWRVDDPQAAVDEAVRRGAERYTGASFLDAPAIYGIGESLIYFVPAEPSGGAFGRFVDLGDDKKVVEDLGFLAIDHLTNNVYKGTMETWSKFYKEIFGFTEVRYFDIKGLKTGLQSYALRSPCGSFSIPINEGNEDKSQIEEYLREYKGPGVQHLAFLSNDLLASLDKLDRSKIDTLDIDDEYYEEVFERVPNVTEDRDRIKKHKVLVDGDEDGYLLQIFTRNIIGPIFIEMIQRKNHHSFGEGNFGALFRSIEKDQERRGVL